MRIEEKYQQGLKQLIKEKPLDEINIVLLCKLVKSNRQTFYYHYRDLSDVVESILLKEKIKYNSKIFDFDSALKSAVAYINSNYSFLYSICCSFASDKVDSFFYSYFNILFTSYSKSNNKINKTIIRYLCNLYSNELMYWIIKKRREKQTDLINRFKVIWNYFSNDYLIDIGKNK